MQRKVRQITLPHAIAASSVRSDVTDSSPAEIVQEHRSLRPENTEKLAEWPTNLLPGARAIFWPWPGTPGQSAQSVA